VLGVLQIDQSGVSAHPGSLKLALLLDVFDGRGCNSSDAVARCFVRTQVRFSRSAQRPLLLSLPNPFRFII